MARPKKKEFTEDVPDVDYVWHNSYQDEAEARREVLSKEQYQAPEGMFDDR